ncbi:MAG: sulfatase-like hydrolase/transferase, partial [Flavobacteriaceae bacterium]|nr:sulfatase-like hydrolase/transferase [Flavobacteriaceae bacterium]
AHTYYPVHLYENEHRVNLENDTIAPHMKMKEGLDPNLDDSYAEFNLNQYAPTLMYEKIEQFVDRSKDNPFFLYWASPIPHNPLQAPKKWVDYYQKKFGEEEPYLNTRGYFPNRTPRATYAAMISYLDENVGKLVKKLKEEGIYENTIILFTSDNGVTYSGGTDGIYFNSSGPFGEEYGRGKGFVYEGGIRVPLIASWPGKIQAGTKTEHMAAQYDIVKTISELTGFELEGSQDGISFYPTLLGQDQKEHEFLYWEFPEYGGQIAIRMGDYKLIRKNLKNQEEPSLELYNLIEDPAELSNIVDKHPELVQKALEIFNREHQTPEVDRFKIPLLEKGLLSNDKQ